MDRYGQAWATTLADTTAPELLNKQRINTLTVIANRLTTLEEVMGIAFYGADDELMALSGVQRLDADYRAQATIDNTPSGSVTVSLGKREIRTRHPLEPFVAISAYPAANPANYGHGDPVQALAETGSLPIVSVPSEPAQEQFAYLLTVKLHNQRSLNQQEQRQAIDDALTMGREVCALYPGFALTLQERALLISKREASSLNALYASFLLQRLLTEYETQGESSRHAINRD